MNLTTPRRKVRKSFDILSGYNYYIPGSGGTAMLLVFLLIGAILGNLVTLGLGFISPALTDFAMLIAYPLMFIPAMLYAVHKSRYNSVFEEGRAVDSSNFGRFHVIPLCIAVIIATLMANFITDPIMKLLPPMPDWFKEMMEKMLLGTPLWATLLSVSVFAPFFEEWLCRGMILRGLLTKVKPGWAMVISSLVFALIHMNPWQAVPAFLLGMLFAYVYYRTGSLKLTMLMHCTNNTFAALMGQVDAFKDIESYSEILSMPVYIGLLIAAVLIIAAFVYSLYRHTELQSPQGNCDVLTADNQ